MAFTGNRRAGADPGHLVISLSAEKSIDGRCRRHGRVDGSIPNEAFPVRRG
jgi:hypothetical protein